MKHKPITLQMIFDLAWQKFIVEGAEPAADSSGMCAYLTADGRKCAVGLALPEGHDAQDSGKGFRGLVDEYSELFDPELVKIARDWDEEWSLGAFQNRLHDVLQKYGKWTGSVSHRADMYRGVAKDFGLTVPSSTSN